MHVSKRRRVFGEKFVDLGNYTIVALIFGQLVAEKINVVLIIVAFIYVVIFWMIGFFLLRRERRRR